ncbi:MAG: hypothetical protein ACR2OZ_20300 [Verrucomicrobiales bacterium]
MFHMFGAVVAAARFACGEPGVQGIASPKKITPRTTSAAFLDLVDKLAGLFVSAAGKTYPV